MKTVSIILEDSVYEELEAMLNELGQVEQTFYEIYTRIALEEWRNTAHKNAENPDKKMNAFKRLESSRIRVSENIDYNSFQEGKQS